MLGLGKRHPRILINSILVVLVAVDDRVIRSRYSIDAGVSNIDANLETKKVAVTHDDTVTKEEMLEKLLKWSAASGKSVALAS